MTGGKRNQNRRRKATSVKTDKSKTIIIMMINKELRENRIKS